MKNSFIDIAYIQRNYLGEHICGDTCVVKHFDGGSRSVVALSDGMGHGVKANVLSSLTANMLVNFNNKSKNIKPIAEFMLKSLPICSVRKVRYSTFSFISVDLFKGTVTIVEYDNPQLLFYRNGVEQEIKWEHISFDSSINNHDTIRYANFKIMRGDRIIAMSDGVTQSGVGNPNYPFGWKRGRVAQFISSILEQEPEISSNMIARRVVEQATTIDDYNPKDDISCVCVSLSSSKNLLICSCPPCKHSGLKYLADFIDNFEGKKVICGYHLARLLSDTTGEKIIESKHSDDPELQPIWHMKGLDLITESLMTLNKVYSLLLNNQETMEGGGAAIELYRLLNESESVTILMGLSYETGGVHNNSDYELRRQVLGHIADTLTEKFGKRVKLIYK